MPFTNEQIARLHNSFRLIKTRLGEVAELFEQSLSEQAPMFNSRFPMDRVSFELNMLLICGHAADVDLLTDRYAEIGEDLAYQGVTADQYPIARQAMLSAFASVSGYTWTHRLENDWAELFDAVAQAAFATMGATTSVRSQAA